MTETRLCQNCKNQFTIEAEDFDFYEKIKVPPPTWCPECRFKRRMAWRNDWHLFYKTDTESGSKILSFIPEESPIRIYDRDYWISDKWDPMSYGKEYDWSKSFFEQFRELLYSVPLPALSVLNLSNCKYCMNADHLKNCYLVRGATYTEDSAYLVWDHGSKQCLDSHMTNACELGVGNVNTSRCYKAFFSVDCEDCQDVILCKDCIGCNSCFGSIGLRNKSYCFFNKPCSKAEYQEKLTELNLGRASTFSSLKTKAYDHWLTFPHKFMHGRQNTNTSGDYVYESKNAYSCFRVRGLEDAKFCQNILQGPAKDCYDYSNWGDNANLLYECLVVGIGVSNIRFCTQCYSNVKNLEYCISCGNSSDLFGCIGLRNKQYAVLNRRHSREEYFALRAKIVAQMNEKPYVDKGGRTYRYGEFFPPEFSFYPYKTSAACEFFPMKEKEAQKEGFAWYPIAKQRYDITLRTNELPDDIKDADDDILRMVIECGHQENCNHECVGAFRIIPQELAFYRRMNLPLPRLCPNCRHYQRLKQRNPLKLWQRNCMCGQSRLPATSSQQPATNQQHGNAGSQKLGAGSYVNTASHFHQQNHCPNTFQTSYAPERPEIVYCEQCYNAEVV